MEKKKAENKIEDPWQIPQLKLIERCFNFFNMMIELNFVNSIFWALFNVYETILWMAMPIMGAQDYTDKHYQTFMKILLSIPYMRYVVSIDSKFGIYLVTTFHVSALLLALIFTLAFIIKAPRRKGSLTFAWKLMGRINIFLYILDNTFLMPPINRNCLLIIYGKLPYFPKKGVGFIVARAIAIICLILHAMFAAISPLFYSSMMTSNAPWAGSLTNLHTFRIAFRFALSLYMAIDIQFKYSGIVCLVLIVPLAIYIYKSTNVLLFYSKVVYFFETLMVWLFFVSLIDLQILKYAKKLVDLSDVLMCFLLSLGFTLVSLIKNSMISSMHFMLPKDLKSISEAELYLTFIWSLPQKIKYDKNNVRILFNIHFLHKSTCQNSQCPCGDVKMSFHSIDSAKLPLHKNYIWELFIWLLIRQVKEKFPKVPKLYIIESVYLSLIMKNKYLAYFKLMEASALNCNLQEQVSLYRQKNELNSQFEDENCSKHRYKLVNKYLEFEQNQHMLTSVITLCIKEVYQFWLILSGVSASMKTMLNVCMAIAQKAVLIDEIYEHMTDEFGVVKHIAVKYLSFLKNVVKEKRISHKIKNQIRMTSSIQFEWEIFSPNSNGGTLIVSCEQGSLGQILCANEKLESILGYTTSELVGSFITKIMPPMFAKCHTTILKQFLQDGITNVVDSKFFTLAQNKNKLIIPILLYASPITTLEKGIRIVGIITTDLEFLNKYEYSFPSNISIQNPCVFLIDSDMNIIGVNQRTYELTHVPITYLKCKEFPKGVKFNECFRTMQAVEAKFSNNIYQSFFIADAIRKHVDQDYLQDDKTDSKKEIEGLLKIHSKVIAKQKLEYYVAIFIEANALNEANLLGSIDTVAKQKRETVDKSSPFMLKLIYSVTLLLYLALSACNIGISWSAIKESNLSVKYNQMSILREYLNYEILSIDLVLEDMILTCQGEHDNHNAYYSDILPEIKNVTNMQLDMLVSSLDKFIWLYKQINNDANSSTNILPQQSNYVFILKYISNVSQILAMQCDEVKEINMSNIPYRVIPDNSTPNQQIVYSTLNFIYDNIKIKDNYTYHQIKMKKIKAILIVNCIGIMFIIIWGIGTTYGIWKDILYIITLFRSIKWPIIQSSIVTIHSLLNLDQKNESIDAYKRRSSNFKITKPNDYSMLFTMLPSCIFVSIMLLISLFYLYAMEIKYKENFDQSIYYYRNEKYIINDTLQLLYTYNRACYQTIKEAQKLQISTFATILNHYYNISSDKILMYDSDYSQTIATLHMPNICYLLYDNQSRFMSPLPFALCNKTTDGKLIHGIKSFYTILVDQLQVSINTISKSNMCEYKGTAISEIMSVEQHLMVGIIHGVMIVGGTIFAEEFVDFNKVLIIGLIINLLVYIIGLVLQLRINIKRLKQLTVYSKKIICILPVTENEPKSIKSLSIFK